ncbi:hypothetical protein Trydic_g9525 [Trypoxylus dichotomus]
MAATVSKYISFFHDNRWQYRDGSDEIESICFHLLCPKDKFRCQYGGCIDKAGRCNSTVECPDESDEALCNVNAGCSYDKFQCFDGRCVDEHEICNGFRDCPDGSDEYETLCDDYRCAKGTFRCRHGGCIPEDVVCDGNIDCVDGSDERGYFCSDLNVNISCQVIESKGVDLDCLSDELGYLPCTGNMPAGTVVQMTCKEHYTPSRKRTNDNVQLRCQPDGNWNGNMLECQPECGRRSNIAETLIMHGKDVTDWPWHSVMYLLMNGQWVASCGGTLVSEDVVLTAAHCVWKRSPRHIKFAFAKYSSDLDRIDDFVQVRDAGTIVTRPEYLDYRSNYGSDIGVVVLSSPVELSTYVKPACLDWERSNMPLHLSGDRFGTIAGMGLMENDEPAIALQVLELPVVSPSACIRNQKRDFRKYVTYTTFCAGWTNGTSVCRGDSGGGILFRDVNDADRWILQGIVSISPRRKGVDFCDPLHYTIFTKVGLYLDWLKDLIK